MINEVTTWQIWMRWPSTPLGAWWPCPTQVAVAVADQGELVRLGTMYFDAEGHQVPKPVIGALVTVESA